MYAGTSSAQLMDEEHESYLLGRKRVDKILASKQETVSFGDHVLCGKDTISLPLIVYSISTLLYSSSL
jgi:hypothetical protein